MDSEKLRNLWSETVGADADWDTLSVEATYRRASPAEPEKHSAPTLAPPSSYTLGAVLGEGGMGTVYRARQNCLRRDVAVKKLKPSSGSAPALEGFLAEAYAHGLLDHPNIVPVYDLGSDAQGGVQLAMKLVAGRSWRARLREDQSVLSEQLEVLCQVCNAVAFAHSRGLAHCDLKPANILLGSFGEVFVVDWGLAVCFDGQADGSLRPHTSIRAPTGTPAYMAPELARGQGEQIGPATDVYLLGACLFEVLSGRPPHQGSAFFEVVERAAEGEIGALPDDLPAELVQICRRALAREPGARYAGALELRDALRTYLEHRQSLAMARAARAQLRACGDTDSAQPRELYERFALAVAGFRQARELWHGNHAAAEGEQQARLAYGAAALRLGDLELADSQCRKADDGRGEAAAACAALLRSIADARTKRVREQTSRRRLRRALAVSVGLLLAGLVVGLLAFAQAYATILARNEQIARNNTALEAEKQRVEQARSFAEQRGEVAQNALTRLIETVDERLLLRGSPASRALAQAILPVAIDGFSALRDTDYAHSRADLGTAATHLLIAHLQHSLGGDAEAALAELDQAEGLLRAQLVDAQASEQLGKVLVERGRLQLTRGFPAAAGADAAEALGLLQRPEARADALLLQASVQRAQGDFSAARTSLLQGLELVAGEARDILQLALGQVLREFGAAQQACELLESCLLAQRRRVQAHPERDDAGWTLSLIHFELGRARNDAGELQGARASLEACLELRRALTRADPHAAHNLQRLAQAEAELARLLYSERIDPRAAALAAEAVARQTELVERDPESPTPALQLAHYLGLQASIAAQQSLYETALLARGQAVEYLQRAIELGSSEANTRRLLAQALEHQARLLLTLGRDGEATLLQCLELLAELRAAEPEDRGLAQIQVRALISLAHLAPASEALELLEDCATILQALPEPAPPAERGHIRLLQAELLSAEGGASARWMQHAAEAEELLEEAARGDASPMLRDHWGRALDLLARGKAGGGLLEEALECAIKAVHVRGAPGMASRPDWGARHVEALLRLAEVVAAQGQISEAWEVRAQALQLCRELRGQHPTATELVPLHVELTQACASHALAQNQPAAALQNYSEAATLASPGSAEHGMWLRRCAELQSLLGDREGAQTAYQKSFAVFDALVRQHQGPAQEIEPELVELVELSAELADMQRENGEPARARAVLERAMELVDERRDALASGAELAAFLERALEDQARAEQQTAPD